MPSFQFQAAGCRGIDKDLNERTTIFFLTTPRLCSPKYIPNLTVRSPSHHIGHFLDTVIFECIVLICSQQVLRRSQVEGPHLVLNLEEVIRTFWMN